MFNLDLLEFNMILNKVKDYAKTNDAKEFILKLEPITNIDEINLKYKELKEASDAIVKYDDLPISNLGDVKSAILRSNIGGILTENELKNISLLETNISLILKYRSYLNSNKINIDNLNLYFDLLKFNSKLKNAIDECIDDNSNILDNASSTLFDIRKRIKFSQNKIRSKLNEILQARSSQISESLIVTRQNKLCIPFKVEFKNAIKGVILDESQSGTTVYIEPYECAILQSELEVLYEKEKKEIEEILKMLSLLVNTISEELLININNITSLDVIYAKAMYMVKEDLIIPLVNDKGIINIKGAKHPLIDKDKVVAQDIILGDKYNTIIITGPNTGGKTVVLKTVGLLTLMMQCAIAIPAKSGSTLSLFDNVFVDIGDDQSISQNLSTFSSHMSKIASILDNVTSSSLVLLDELGSGTDPKEGASLAISIIDYLKDRGARSIITTHYSDLKEYAYKTNDVINASVEFDSETLMPTFRLLIGIPGKSNALYIAKKLGINESIINNASSLVKNDSTDTINMINRLEDDRESIRVLEKEYKEKLEEYNKLLSDVKIEKSKLESKANSIIKKAYDEAKDIIEDAKTKSNDVLKEIDKLKKDSNIKEHEIADIKYVARNLNVKEKQSNILDEDLKVGDYVFVESYNKDGVITNIKKDKYEVQIGQFKFSFKKSELRLTKPPVNVKKTYKKPVGKTPAKEAHLELDLRGYRYEEVAPAVDTFIDRAYMANLSMIYVIHGFGTGAVRKALYEYLKKCPYVKSTRFGGEGEGLNGVTVVYLK